MNSDATVNVSLPSFKNGYNRHIPLSSQSVSQREAHALPLAQLNGPPLGPDRRETQTDDAVDLHNNFHGAANDLNAAMGSIDEVTRVTPPSTVVEECAFCRYLGTPRTCGPLNQVILGGEGAMVHHACALWAADVYQTEVSISRTNCRYKPISDLMGPTCGPPSPSPLLWGSANPPNPT